MTEELLMIAKNLMILSNLVDAEEQKYIAPPGFLQDAIYSIAQHIERLAEEVNT